MKRSSRAIVPYRTRQAVSREPNIMASIPHDIIKLFGMEGLDRIAFASSCKYMHGALGVTVIYSPQFDNNCTANNAYKTWMEHLGVASHGDVIKIWFSDVGKSYSYPMNMLIACHLSNCKYFRHRGAYYITDRANNILRAILNMNDGLVSFLLETISPKFDPQLCSNVSFMGTFAANTMASWMITNSSTPCNKDHPHNIHCINHTRTAAHRTLDAILLGAITHNNIELVAEICQSPTLYIIVNREHLTAAMMRGHTRCVALICGARQLFVSKYDLKLYCVTNGFTYEDMQKCIKYHA